MCVCACVCPCLHVANHSALQSLPGLLLHGPLFCLIGSNLSGRRHGFFSDWLLTLEVLLRRKTTSSPSPWREWYLEDQECEESSLPVHTCPSFICRADIWPGSWRQSGKIKASEATCTLGIFYTQSSSRAMSSLNVISLLNLLCAFNWKAGDCYLLGLRLH